MGEIVQNGREVKPPPADDLQVGKSVCQSWLGAVVFV
jgi:hypothetical protein